MGVETHFEGNEMTLVKLMILNLKMLISNLIIHQILHKLVVTCLGIGCHLTGLHTLKIKETDRLEALRIELTNHANIFVTNDSLTLLASNTINPHIKIATYNDHRMAMAFAPLALKVPIIIEAEVVSKSYPDFWKI
jgi:3-phosphoshikimate 1-carboxyvinyltransferase